MTTELQFVRLKMVVEERGPVYSEPISNPTAAARLAAGIIGDADAEQLLVISLDVKNRINAAHIVSRGTLDASIAHPREVYKAAILSNAASILLVHNHPSGDVAPSAADLTATGRLLEAGRLLGIDLLDSVIVGPNGQYCSMRERGLLSLGAERAPRSA